MAARPQNITGLRLGKRPTPTGGRVLSAIGTANPDTRSLLPTPRRKARAVEADVGSAAAPFIRDTNLAARKIDDRARRRNVIIRAVARRGAATAVITAVVAVATIVVARATIVRRFRFGFLLNLLNGRLGFGGKRSLTLLIVQRLRLGGKCIVRRLELLGERRAFLHCLVGFFHLIGRFAFLFAVFIALRFVIGTQLLGFGNHLRVVFVHPGKHVPVLHEVIERIGTQNDVEKRGLTVAIHIVRTIAELTLKVFNALVVVVDFRLTLVHLRRGGIVSVDRGGVIFDLLVQIGIELQQFLKRSIGLRLFFSRRRLSESEFRRRNGNAECGGATHKCTARKIHVFIHKPGPHRLVEII